MMDDYISRQAAIEAINRAVTKEAARRSVEGLPSVQPEIIRCKDCRWWDKRSDYGIGYCMAAKHGYWTSHWDISIRRKYEGDFYCADAEMRGE